MQDWSRSRSNQSHLGGKKTMAQQLIVYRYNAYVTNQANISSCLSMHYFLSLNAVCFSRFWAKMRDLMILKRSKMLYAPIRIYQKNYVMKLNQEV